jgi:hypothetical protein
MDELVKIGSVSEDDGEEYKRIVEDHIKQNG